MASLYKQRGKWYARVSLWNGVKQSFKKIPLYTDSKVVARVRFGEVNKVETDIKSGMTFEFSWMTDSCVTKVLPYSMNIAIAEYLKYLKTNGAKESTVERAGYCLRNFQSSLGINSPISCITAKDIEYFKHYFSNKLSKNGININLTRIRAFLNWCVEIKDILGKCPKITFIKCPQKHPSYLNEGDLNKIKNLKGLSIHYKTVFQMYWQTGIRLREAFNGRVEGNWLVIDSLYSKNGIQRDIYLENHHAPVILELQARYFDSNSNIKAFPDRYSKMFKKVMRKIGREKLHFHNLRDTFAVMRYLETRDIYQVSKELGHSSLKVTEKYAKLNIRKIEDDFPTYAKSFNKRKIVKSSIMTTDIMTTANQNTAFIDGGNA